MQDSSSKLRAFVIIFIYYWLCAHTIHSGTKAPHTIDCMTPRLVNIDLLLQISMTLCKIFFWGRVFELSYYHTVVTHGGQNGYFSSSVERRKDVGLRDAAFALITMSCAAFWGTLRESPRCRFASIRFVMGHRCNSLSATRTSRQCLRHDTICSLF